MATWGSRDWTSVSSMMFRVPPCAVPAAAEEAPLAAEDAAVELEEPPQAVRASAAEVTPAAARKLRRRNTTIVISYIRFPLSLMLYTE